MEGRNIYQLGLREGRIVRLLSSDLDRRPVAVTYDDLRQVLYWTDVAEASIVSRQLTHLNVIARQTTVYTAGMPVCFPASATVHCPAPRPV